MRIRIDVQQEGTGTRAEPGSVIFGAEGGSIGRSKGNDLVLSGKDISRTHAMIKYENGRFFLQDTSTNGTILCREDSDVLVQQDEVELADKDSFKIGDYLLFVSILEKATRSRPGFGDAPSISSFEFESEEAKRPSPAAVPPSPAGVSEGAGALESRTPKLPQKGLSIDDLFSDTGFGTPPAGPEGAMREQGLPSEPEDVAPDFRSEPGATRDMPVEDAPAGGIAREPVVTASFEPAVSGGESFRQLFDLFLKGARVNDASFIGDEEIPEIMANLGVIFREMAEGLWTILRGRAETKAEVRVAMTVVCPEGNNPLKMSPGIDDIMRHLLKRQHRGFLEPAEAVHQGFEDIINHQLAMNAGIRASLLEALDRFDPSHFEEGGKEWIPQHRKIKCWNAYTAAYQRLKDEAFEGFFGKAFAEAYEEQLDKLRSKAKEKQNKS